MLGLRYGIFSSLSATGSTPTIIPSKLEYRQYNAGGVMTDVLSYTPENATTNLPLLIFYPGDGGKGTVTVVTGQTVGTGNGVKTVFTGTCTNGGDNRVLSTSAVVMVNNMGIATGTTSGAFSGGVTGTIAFNNSGSTFSIAFPTPVPNGHVVKIAYKYCPMLKQNEGIPYYLNNGDKPIGMYILSPCYTSTELDLSKHFDDLVNYAVSTFNINTNRIYVTGLSRGAFQVKRIAQSRYSGGTTNAIAGLIQIAGTTTSIPWQQLGDASVGQYYVHGTNDGTVSYAGGLVFSSTQGLSLNVWPDNYAVWNGGHNQGVWDSYCYNRTTSIANTGFDYVSWIKAFSRDQAERATLHVERAEIESNISRHKMSYYRLAMKQVESLNSGTTKTALQGRLNNVLDSIGAVYALDWGASANQTTGLQPTGYYNNLISASNGGSVSNLVDIENNSSVIDVSIPNQTTNAGTKVNTQPRLERSNWGMAVNTCFDAAIIQVSASTNNAQFKYTSVPAGTYDVIFYACAAASTGEPLNRTLWISGMTGIQTVQTVHNTMYPIRFNGLSPNGSSEIVFNLKATTGNDARINAVDLIKR